MTETTKSHFEKMTFTIKYDNDTGPDDAATAIDVPGLVRQLREMLDEYELIKRERAAMQESTTSRWPRLPEKWAALQDRADKVSGRIMRQERAIIEMLLKLPNDQSLP